MKVLKSGWGHNMRVIFELAFGLVAAIFLGIMSVLTAIGLSIMVIVWKIMGKDEKDFATFRKGEDDE
jgi:ABC-type tungstate transport system substrate-binding protein